MSGRPDISGEVLKYLGTALRVARTYGGRPGLRDTYEEDEAYSVALEGVWRALSTYEPDRGTSVATWVYYHAVRRCQDWARRDRDRHAGYERPLGRRDFPDRPDHAAPFEAAEAVAWLLGGLDDRQRLLLRLCHWEGATYSEAGAELGVTASAACRMHGRLLAELRVKLERSYARGVRGCPRYH